MLIVQLKQVRQNLMLHGSNKKYLIIKKVGFLACFFSCRFAKEW